MNHNKEDASPEEIKTFLHRSQQYNQFAEATTTQPFHQASLNQMNAPRQAEHQQSDVKRQSRRFAGNCFYCDKPGYREAECRQKAGDIESGRVKQK